MIKTDNQKSNNLMKKNFIWNTIGSTLYAFTSLFFMIIATRINGVEDAGMFTFAFCFATVMQVFSLYQGRTFQVTERSKSISDSDFIYFRFFTCFVMIAISLIFVSLRGYSFFNILVIVVLVLYKCLDGFSESLYGVFQKHNNLFQCGISYTLKSVLTVLFFLIVNLITNNLLYSCLGILLADIIVFVFYDLLCLKTYKLNFKILKKSTFMVLIIGGFSVFIFTFLSQYLVNCQKYIIDFLSSHSDQTIFGIIVMPATFISLCAQLIINPFLYKINESLENKEFKLFRNIVIKLSLIVFILGIIVIVVSYFIGIPILNLIYGINLNDYLFSLIVILCGSTFFGIIAVLSNALISIRKNISQIIYYLIASICATLLSACLVPMYGVFGASVAFCVSYFILFVIFSCAFYYETRKMVHNKNSLKGIVNE